jgi:hypothetical protein
MFTGGQSILDRFLAQERRQSVTDLLGDMNLDGVGTGAEHVRDQLSRVTLSPPKGATVNAEMDDNNGFMWFTAMPLEGNSEEYYLAGVVLGLAIFNSTLLDIRFPGALYRKLMNHDVGIADLEQFRPVRALISRDDESTLTLYGPGTCSWSSCIASVSGR